MSQKVSKFQPSGLDAPWLTLPQATEYLQVSRATLYRLMEQGVLPYYRVTGTRQRRFKKEDLDQLMVLESPEQSDITDLDEED